MDKIKKFQEFLSSNRDIEKKMAYDLIKESLKDKLKILDDISDIIPEWEDDGIVFEWEPYIEYIDGLVEIFGTNKRIKTQDISNDIAIKLSEDSDYLVKVLNYWNSNPFKMIVYLWLNGKRLSVEQARIEILRRCKSLDIKSGYNTNGWTGLVFEIE